jgi:hypothetical protein
MRQPMRSFEGEDFEDIHAALYRRHRRIWFPEERRDGASLRNHAPHAVAADRGRIGRGESMVPLRERLQPRCSCLHSRQDAGSKTEKHRD